MNYRNQIFRSLGILFIHPRKFQCINSLNALQETQIYPKISISVQSNELDVLLSSGLQTLIHILIHFIKQKKDTLNI